MEKDVRTRKKRSWHSPSEDYTVEQDLALRISFRHQRIRLSHMTGTSFPETRFLNGNDNRKIFPQGNILCILEDEKHCLEEIL